jgi:hypothetical protein
MTEAEWLVCTSPERMLRFLWATASDRKLRLFAVACARRLSHLSTGEFGRRMNYLSISQRLAVAERFADGASSVGELEAAWDAGMNVRVLGAAPAPWRAEDYAEAAAGDACNREASSAALWAMLDGQDAADPWAKTDQSGEMPEGTEHHPQVSLLRDIFGNPFRPVVFSPEWRTSTAVTLAAQMYESRDFGAMPILADALQDAGCDNENILAHCRDANATHVRGCWVVDLVLGEE